MTTKIIHHRDVRGIRADAVKPGDILMEGVVYEVEVDRDTAWLSVIFGTVAVPPHSTVQIFGRIGEDILPAVLRAMRKQANDPEVVTAD